jgi:hypothetical protein
MSDCLLVKKLLGIDCDCCESCHVDYEEYGDDLCEVGIAGDSYFVCCAVQVAAFAPQPINSHVAPPAEGSL